MSVDLDPARPQSDDDVDVRLEGTVSSVRHFPDSRFTILRVYETGSAELSTWVGKSAGVEEGASVSAAGVWKVHHTYGRQFHFLRLVIKQPTTPEGISPGARPRVVLISAAWCQWCRVLEHEVLRDQRVITEIERVVRIRTGETDDSAL